MNDLNFIDFSNVTIIDEHSYAEVQEYIDGQCYQIAIVGYDYINEGDKHLVYFDAIRKYLDEDVLFVYVSNSKYWGL